MHRSPEFPHARILRRNFIQYTQEGHCKPASLPFSDCNAACWIFLPGWAFEQRSHEDCLKCDPAKSLNIWEQGVQCASSKWRIYSFENKFFQMALFLQKRRVQRQIPLQEHFYCSTTALQLNFLLNGEWSIFSFVQHFQIWSNYSTRVSKHEPCSVPYTALVWKTLCIWRMTQHKVVILKPHFEYPIQVFHLRRNNYNIQRDKTFSKLCNELWELNVFNLEPWASDVT